MNALTCDVRPLSESGASRLREFIGVGRESELASDGADTDALALRGAGGSASPHTSAERELLRDPDRDRDMLARPPSSAASALSLSLSYSVSLQVTSRRFE